MPILDTTGRFLTDLKKIISLHASCGIDSYPLTPELRDFFRKALPRPQSISKNPKVTASPSPRYRKKEMDKEPLVTSSLMDIRQQLGDCTRCDLHENRSGIMFGRGSQEAELFIISEYPNIVDDAEGLLFSGPDGDLLAKMLAAINLDMEQVYLGSIVKCRASAEKPPNSKEVAACLPFLMAQIAAVSPKVICTMGTLAAHVLLKSKQPLIRLRGRWRQLNGIPLMATFHPSYLLKNQEMKKAAWQDLQTIQNRLKE